MLGRRVKGKKFVSRATCDEPRCLCVAVLRLWVTDVLGSPSVPRRGRGRWAR